jgi:hypothetical protein
VKTIGNLGLIATCACLLAYSQPARANGAQLGNMQADKILFLGNSITFCPQVGSAEWWGLTASTPAKDYAHLLTQRINTATGGSLTIAPPNPSQGDARGRWYYGNPLPNYNGNILNMADIFERNFNTWDNARIQNQLDAKPDIVVVQLGENMVGGTNEQFRVALKELLTGLKNSSNPQIFVTSYIMGEPAGVGDIKRQICAEDPTHRTFVDLSAVLQDTTNVGGYAHPNDKGMAVIADTVFNAMVTHSIPEPTSLMLSSTALVAAVWYAWRKRKQQ